MMNVNFQITGNGSLLVRMDAAEVAAWTGVDLGTLVSLHFGENAPSLFKLNERRLKFDPNMNETELLIFLRPHG